MKSVAKEIMWNNSKRRRSLLERRARNKTLVIKEIPLEKFSSHDSLSPSTETVNFCNYFIKILKIKYRIKTQLRYTLSSLS